MDVGCSLGASVSLFCLAVVSCGGPVGGTATELRGIYGCEDVSDVDGLWVVEWDAAERGRVLAEAEDGLLLARYKGCELKVLYGCEIEGAYTERATALNADRVEIESEQDLYAKIKVRAFDLAASYERGEKWALDYAVTGHVVHDGDRPSWDDVAPGCRSATHYVSGMAVGAYVLAKQREDGVGLEGSGPGPAGVGIGAGAGHQSREGVVRSSGDLTRCVEGSTDPRSCGGLVKVYLSPIGGGPRPREPLGNDKTWVALRGGGGSYGAAGTISLYTLYWPQFYFALINMSGGGGVPNMVSIIHFFEEIAYHLLVLRLNLSLRSELLELCHRFLILTADHKAENQSQRQSNKQFFHVALLAFDGGNRLILTVTAPS